MTFGIRNCLKRGTVRHLPLVLICWTASGCALPAAGPTMSQVENPQAGLAFSMVRVDKRVANILHRNRKLSLRSTLSTGRYVATNALRPGDAVAVTIYESGGSALFSPPSSSPVTQPAAPGSGTAQPSLNAGVTTIPPQVVEADGTITVPFAGRVTVEGKTPGEVGREVEKQLKGKAVDPQVVVTMVNNATNAATVGGDVGAPRSVALSLRGERLLDVIAQAGGAKFPAYETWVRVVRDGRVGRVLMQTVISNPAENITIRPNDQIFLTRNPRTFAVMGAAQKVSQYTFDTETVTLAEAVARAGGPVDTIGDPSGVYLFRFEPWSVAVEVAGKSPAEAPTLPRSDFVPILYQIGFREAQGYFLSQAIQLRDKDVVFISNAEATQLQKALAVVRGFTGIAYDLTRQVNVN